MKDQKPKEFPKWKYNAKKAAVIVKNEAEEKDLGEGWENSPAAFEEGSKEVSLEEKKVEELKEMLLNDGYEEEDFKGLKKSDLIELAKEIEEK